MTWHPIETAPRDGTAVLVYIPDADPRERLTTVYWLGDYWELCQIGDPSDASQPQSEPTHWMPLPPRPSDKETIMAETSNEAVHDHVLPVENPMREGGADAAAVLFPGSLYARAGFNAGVAWTLTQIRSNHPEAWKLLERAWKERQP